MTSLPIVNRLMLVVLTALAVVQLKLAQDFWGGIATGPSAWVFQTLGVGLGIVEILALPVSAHAAAQGRVVRATYFRLLFPALFAANLVADVGAISAVAAADASRRASELAAFNAVQTEAATRTVRIAKLEAELSRQGLDLPVEAIENLRQAASIAAGAPGLRRTERSRREQRVAEIDAATAVARELDDLRAAGGRPVSPPPSADHPQLTTLQNALSSVGVEVQTDRLQAFLTGGIALVLHLALPFGFWVALIGPTKARAGQQPEAEPAQSGSTPGKPAAKRGRPPGPARAKAGMAAAMDDFGV